MELEPDQLGGGGRVGDLDPARRGGRLAALDVAHVAERLAVVWCSPSCTSSRVAVVAERHEVAAGAELEVVADRGGGGGDLAELDALPPT